MALLQGHNHHTHSHSRRVAPSQRHYGTHTTADGQPTWFVELKRGFTPGITQHMTEDGPWDMLASRCCCASQTCSHARAIRYTLCSAMQRHFTDAVVPVLGLQYAVKDATRARLERCIIAVRHRGCCVCSYWFDFCRFVRLATGLGMAVALPLLQNACVPCSP